MTYIEKRVQQLFAVDSIRLGKFIEFIQFSLVFTILALISAYLINKHLFYSLTEDDSLMKIITKMRIKYRLHMS